MTELEELLVWFRQMKMVVLIECTTFGEFQISVSRDSRSGEVLIGSFRGETLAESIAKTQEFFATPWTVSQ